MCNHCLIVVRSCLAHSSRLNENIINNLYWPSPGCLTTNWFLNLACFWEVYWISNTYYALIMFQASPTWRMRWAGRDSRASTTASPSSTTPSPSACRPASRSPRTASTWCRTLTNNSQEPGARGVLLPVAAPPILEPKNAGLRDKTPWLGHSIVDSL